MQLALVQPLRRNAAPRRVVFANALNTVSLWLATKRKFVELRGSDPDPRNRRSAIPRTTNGDVIQLSTQWTGELSKVIGKMLKSDVRRWSNCVEQVSRVADASKPGAPYPANVVFWRCTQRLARDLESVKVIPSQWDLAVESVLEAASELPDRLADGAGAVAGAAKSLLTEPLIWAAALGAGGLLLLAGSRR